MRPIIEILLGLLLTMCTLIIHSVGMYLVMHRFELNWQSYLKETSEFRRQFFFGHLTVFPALKGERH